MAGDAVARCRRAVFAPQRAMIDRAHTRRGALLALLATAIASRPAAAKGADEAVQRLADENPSYASAGQGALLLPDGYLSTAILHGQPQIIDAAGHPVRIHGIAIAGAEGKAGTALHDLYRLSVPAICDEIKAAGFNCLRLPYSDVNLDAPMLNTNGALDANRHLEGRTLFEVFDSIVVYCGAIGLKVIFDHHNNDGRFGQQANGLWFDHGADLKRNVDGPHRKGGGTGTVTYEQFRANWVTLAKRYAGNPTVIGCDLHNEPTAYGDSVSPGAQWDASERRTNARYMWSDVGSAILAINPRLLILCQAPIVRAASGSYIMDFRPARTVPPVLREPAQLVYDFHDYAQNINGGPADYDAQQHRSDRNTHIGWLLQPAAPHAAPLICGEFGAGFRDGGAQNDTLAGDVLWSNELAAWMNGTGGNDADGQPCPPPLIGRNQGCSNLYWQLGPEGAGAAPPGLFNGIGIGTADVRQLEFNKRLQFQIPPVT